MGEFRYAVTSATNQKGLRMSEVSKDQAIEFHKGLLDFALMAHGAARDAAEAVGQMKQIQFVRSLLSAQGASLLRQIKESKAYQSEINPANGRGFTWEDFCSERLGMSRPHADEQIGLLSAYGGECFDAMAALNIGGRKIRMLLQAPEEMRDGVQAALNAPPEERAERLQMVVDEMTVQVGRAKIESEQLGHRLDQTIAEIDKRKRNEARVEDDNRMLRKENNELKSGWSPSEEETEAIEQLNQINGVIQQHFAKMHLIILRAGHHRPVLNHLHGILQNDYGLEDGWVSLTREKLGDKLNEEAHRTAAEPAGKGGRK